MVKLPTGYEKFHKNKFLNHQMNRWYSLGYAVKEDIERIAEKINSIDDYINEFMVAADIAKDEGRLKNAATYLRASEF
jgi:flagellin-specific chaperone FliS